VGLGIFLVAQLPHRQVPRRRSLLEFRHLQITGKLLRPAGLKTDAVEVPLLPSNDMSEERRKDHKPIALGGLDVYQDAIKGSIGIPADVQKIIE
jgi:hypothetical protein